MSRSVSSLFLALPRAIVFRLFVPLNKSYIFFLNDILKIVSADGFAILHLSVFALPECLCELSGAVCVSRPLPLDLPWEPTLPPVWSVLHFLLLSALLQARFPEGFSFLHRF